ncbi:efflux RND transporter periplasmic adaptor subunit [Maioricimonas rarisocia]|nr:efflux RND transporter periplasmic adaptor subunit [Maioricimonas rarisocia]
MQTELASLQTKLQLEEEELKHLNEQIEACTIVAPEPGVVVYANLRGRREQDQIREGSTVRERQAIINLPDVTKLKVGCRIHESLIGAVRIGQPVLIYVDAKADDVYNGKVSAVASVASQGDWPNTDLREYATEIVLTDPPAEIADLKPGLTAKIEIIVDSRQDVLQVPVQCVVAVAHERLAWVLTDEGPERRTLKIGKANTSHIEILDGIAEGERVVQNPRTHFAKAISDREAELSAEEDQNTAETTEVKLPAAPEGEGTGKSAAGRNDAGNSRPAKKQAGSRPQGK